MESRGKSCKKMNECKQFRLVGGARLGLGGMKIYIDNAYGTVYRYFTMASNLAHPIMFMTFYPSDSSWRTGGHWSL